MDLTIYSAIALVIVILTVLGFVIKKVKQLLLVALIFMLLSGSFTAVQFSPNKLLNIPNITYVQSATVDTVEVIPLFGKGSVIGQANFVDVLKGPTSVMVEYNSKKVLSEYLKRYN